VDPRPLSYIAAACGGELRCGSPATRVRRVTTDSRRVQAGDLFFALQGERFDGHTFVGEVARRGAAAAVVARAKTPQTDIGCGIILVDDPRRALGGLAGRYRGDFSLPIVAVAGSNGKTTTKELLAAVLREKLATLASEASFNNDVGVPATLLKLERDHGVAVLEAGTNHPGELRPLVEMIAPEIGVITNIGREHLEFFGDLAGVAQEEGALAEVLPPNGKLFLNGDDEWTPSIVRRTKASVVRVGLGDANDWRAQTVQTTETGTVFRSVAPRSEFAGDCRLNLLGRHQAVNALFAIAVGAELGLSPDEVRRGLLRCQAPKMRLQVWEVHGVRVLDDSYNANADSMHVALQTLCDLPCAGRRVAILGDMAELGPETAGAHREAGQRAAELGVKRLIAVGRWARATAESARAAGLRDVTEFPDVPAAAAAVSGLVAAGDVVLLKASRAAGLERLGDALRGTAQKGTP
jgi:UDP-N-acetylmuramoyl-tripeptide--D-alanyl-D-alanine ligase